MSFTLPKTAAACADLLYTTRQKRLGIQKEVDALADQEREIKDALINALERGEANGVAGKIARVAIVTKEVPQVEDWVLVYDYIKSHDAFEILQRRLNDTAIKERWEDNQQVPGVGRFNKLEVSCVKV